MLDHTVEIESDVWLLHAAPVRAHSALHAVIRSAREEGRYRARTTDEPVSASEYFWVPRWGQPIPLARA